MSDDASLSAMVAVVPSNVPENRSIASAMLMTEANTVSVKVPLHSPSTMMGAAIADVFPGFALF